MKNRKKYFALCLLLFFSFSAFADESYTLTQTSNATTIKKSTKKHKKKKKKSKKMPSDTSKKMFSPIFGKDNSKSQLAALEESEKVSDAK